MEKAHLWSLPDNFLGLDSGASSLDNARFVVLPVPFDSTTTFRTGARNGPRAIIEASKQVELYDMDAGKEIVPKTATLEFLEPAAGDAKANCERVKSVVAEILKEKRIPVILGGDHSVSIGAIECLPKGTVVVSLDAHGDLRDEYEGSRFSHACVMKRALDGGMEVVEVGVRAISAEEAALVKKSPGRITLVSAEEIFAKGIEAAVKKITGKLEGKNVYLTIDIDGFDPSEAPGTGTPEPGGLSYREGLAVITAVCESAGKVFGFDVVEVSPTGTDNVTEFLAAKLLYKMMSCLTA